MALIAASRPVNSPYFSIRCLDLVARAGAAGDPRRLLPQQRDQAAVSLLVVRQALGPGLEIARVIPRIRRQRPAIDFHDPLRHPIQKIPIVSHEDHRLRIRQEEVLEPGRGRGIQMVGRLIQQEEVGRLEDEAGQRHPLAQAAAERPDDRLLLGKAQLLQNRVDAVGKRPGVVLMQPGRQSFLFVESFGAQGLIARGLRQFLGHRLVARQHDRYFGQRPRDRSGHRLSNVQVGLLGQIADGGAASK
ncbi:MAG: hypothetical protein ABIO65_11190 [Nitrospiria bacterium]